MLVTRRGNRTQGAAVKSVGKGNNVGATRDFSSQLHGGFHRISAGGTGKLPLIIHFPELYNLLPEYFTKARLGDGMHNNDIGGATASNILQQRTVHNDVVQTIF